eukprot:gene10206-biopygen11516
MNPRAPEAAPLCHGRDATARVQSAAIRLEDAGLLSLHLAPQPRHERGVPRRHVAVLRGVGVDAVEAAAPRPAAQPRGEVAGARVREALRLPRRLADPPHQELPQPARPRLRAAAPVDDEALHGGVPPDPRVPALRDVCINPYAPARAPVR